MPTQLSNVHHKLVLNGHVVQGFSEDDPPVEFDAVTLAEITRGRDGTMYSMSTGMRGTAMTVKLLPTAPSVPFFMRAHAQIQQGTVIDWSGSYGDSALGASCTMTGGVMVECPPAISPGKTFEVKFEFEQTIPDFDGADFAPSPESVGR